MIKSQVTIVYGGRVIVVDYVCLLFLAIIVESGSFPFRFIDIFASLGLICTNLSFKLSQRNRQRINSCLDKNFLHLLIPILQEYSTRLRLPFSYVEIVGTFRHQILVTCLGHHIKKVCFWSLSSGFLHEYLHKAPTPDTVSLLKICDSRSTYPFHR